MPIKVKQQKGQKQNKYQQYNTSIIFFFCGKSKKEAIKGVKENELSIYVYNTARKLRTRSLQRRARVSFTLIRSF